MSESLDHLQTRSQQAPPYVEPAPAATLREIPGKIGRYSVLKLLGEGGFGRVYLGFDEQLNRQVAIKTPLREMVARPEDAEAYLDEARVLASLDHPGIVPVHDVGRMENGLPFVVSKYVEGIDLAHRNQEGRLPLTGIAELIASIAEALHYAHSKGLVHRDIKPANILLDTAGRPTVADFGLALREDQFGKGARFAGTPAYMSPEQARGEGHRVDGRSDIFSLGVMLYELLTGRRPFRADSQDELLDEITSVDPRPPRQFNDAIPREVERVCQKAMAKKAAERYSTAKDLADDLRQYLASAARAESPSASPTAPTKALAAGASTDAVTATPTSDGHLIKVIPKGLRSFDARDSDFFLELLPGPRDREGLPESLRFWKTRIEERDADSTFAVGLIYGPSGCGKSSLIKAGLIPRLSSDVIPIYIEATPAETEQRLLKGLRKYCIDLAPGLDLAGAMAALRREKSLAGGKKILLVLDQFEQWLHAWRNAENTELVRAMRQCDGGCLQAIVMVREEFWMPASRFMDELEIQLVGGENFAAVDLFPVRHAVRVLAAFGRAFGALPAKAGDLSKEQTQFLDQATASLAKDGKVVCVHLALFAEMMKEKPWTAAGLKAAGGAVGIGETFLEETFGTAAAPEHRAHQRAARAVLSALLPESGTEIKGHMRSSTELCAAAGYQQRPKEFGELVRILDNETRLITPTNADGKTSEGNSVSTDYQGENYYQLTHDYLVHSLRDWLTRKQKETRRGRIELFLADRAQVWNARPENRQLPSFNQCLLIHRYTKKSSWTPPQRKMMSRAIRYHAVRAAVFGLFLVAFLVAGLVVRTQVLEQIEERETAGMVQALLKADLAKAPAILAELEKRRFRATPLLLAEQAKATDGSAEKLHAALALLPDSDQVEYVYRQLLEVPAPGVPVLRTLLAPYKVELTPRLWGVALQAGSNQEQQRLRAAAALAELDPEALGWNEIGSPVARTLVAVPPVYLSSWIESFRPVGDRLLEPLAVVFKDKNRSQIERSLAAEFLADYASANARVLADLLMEADSKQFEVLFPKAARQREQVSTQLLAELDQRTEPRWNDPPIDPSWKNPDSGLVKQIESARGLVAERFAFCQAMPLHESLTLIEKLRASGYRPIRFRPFSAGDSLLAAIAWTRDGQSWRLIVDKSASEVAAADTKSRQDGFYPDDLTIYSSGGKEHYAVLWSQGPANATISKLAADLSPAELRKLDADLRGQGFWCLTVAASRDGSRNGGIWTRPPGRKPPTNDDSTATHFMGNESDYAANDNLADLQLDVRLCPGLKPAWNNDHIAMQLERAEKELSVAKETPWARFQRAQAFMGLGKPESALADFGWLLERDSNQTAPYRYRAIAFARLGKAKEAKEDLEKLKILASQPSQTAYTEAVVSALVADDSDWMKRLDTVLTTNASEAAIQFDGARAYAVAAKALEKKNPAKSGHCAKRAVTLINETTSRDSLYFSRLSTEPDFESLYDLPEFSSLLQSRRLDFAYTAVWHPVGSATSVELHGLDPLLHLAKARELIELGYRPGSISLATSGSRQLAASVWRRPAVEEQEKEWRALRRANAAVALLQLDSPDRVWPLFRQGQDNRVRSYLIHRVGPVGTNPNILVRRLEVEKEASARRALLLAIGEFSEHGLQAAQREALAPKLFELYRNDPDAGVHAAIAWVFGKWGERDKIKAIDAELAQLPALPAFSAELGQGAGQSSNADQPAASSAAMPRWFVNSLKQTMIWHPGTDYLEGSPRGEETREGGPLSRMELLHHQRIGHAFALAAHEITVAQFRALRAGHQINEQYADHPDAPANLVTWYQAAEFCNLLSEKENIPKDQWCYETNASGQYAAGMKVKANHLNLTGYRLPTEAEWEFACRAGTVTSRYYGESEDLLDKYAWYTKNSLDRRMIPVGSMKPNDWGFSDMLGNAAEWTQDQRVYYTSGVKGRPREDRGAGSDVKDDAIKVLRGGSFDARASLVRSAYRLPGEAKRFYFNVGFRPARTIK